MKVVITSGGTRERIDNVRTISNTSSGRLGQCIAEAFLGVGAEVIYIHGPQARIPQGDVQCIEIESALDLLNEVETVLEDPDVNVFIHAMAVSDYSVLSVTSFEALAKLLEHKDAQEIKDILEHFEGGYDRTHKIGSNEPGMAVLMKQAPKIISKIKHKREDIILVGFKLLVDVSKETLIQVGYDLLKKNHCDYVLANDSTLIRDDNHVGYLISSDQSYKAYTTKQEIAAGIVAHILGR